MPLPYSTEITCPICPILLDSHDTFRETGKLIDEHITAKHPEYLTDEEILRNAEDLRYEAKGLT